MRVVCSVRHCSVLFSSVLCLCIHVYVQIHFFFYSTVWHCTTNIQAYRVVAYKYTAQHSIAYTHSAHLLKGCADFSRVLLYCGVLFVHRRYRLFCGAYTVQTRANTHTRTHGRTYAGCGETI